MGQHVLFFKHEPRRFCSQCKSVAEALLKSALAPFKSLWESFYVHVIAGKKMRYAKRHL